MIEEHARVLQLRDKLAVIEIQRQNACQSCELSGGCGTGSLGRLLGQRAQIYTIPNEQNLKAGDDIVIGMPDRSFLLASLMMYVLPLLTMLLAALTAQLIFNASDGAVALIALTGLGLGLYATIRLSASDFARRFQPRFMRRELKVSIH
jgi:sigma-E factor negative regulatory protein RseC